jgi:hypothetical protein
VLVRHPPTAAALACAAAAGILSSAVPLLADLFALRRVPAGSFGLFMSVNPVLAAFAGLAILRQSLSWGAWLSIGAIAAANAVSAMRRQVPASPRAPAIRVHRQDHSRGDDSRARDPGLAQPLPEQQGREDGAGQGLEQGQQDGRARGGRPQGTVVNARIGKSLLRREGKGRGSGAYRTHPDGEHSPGRGSARQLSSSHAEPGARGLSPR